MYKNLKSMRLKQLLTLVLLLLQCQSARAQGRDPVVAIQTTKGPIIIRVFLGMAPYTARNFLDLVSRGFYNGLTFHRVESWCIQGGDPNGNGTGSFIDPQTGQARYLNLEINPSLHHNAAGVVSMARANNPNSASCQFFITKQPCGFLDNQYAIFGGVVDGVRTVQSIQRGDRIISAEILEQGGPSRPPSSSSSSGSVSSSSSHSSSSSSSAPKGPVDSGF
jgi:cyclophilin family peptidyl-prolyl cis-trans isomerase